MLPAGPIQGAYRLRPRSSSNQATPPGFALRSKGAKITILLDGSLFSEYRTDVGAKPFLYPLVGPTGVPTPALSRWRRWPARTMITPINARSGSLTARSTRSISGLKQSGHGTIKETARESLVSGPVLARLCTSDDWMGPDGRRSWKTSVCSPSTKQRKLV